MLHRQRHCASPTRTRGYTSMRRSSRTTSRRDAAQAPTLALATAAGAARVTWEPPRIPAAAWTLPLVARAMPKSPPGRTLTWLARRRACALSCGTRARARLALSCRAIWAARSASIPTHFCAKCAARWASPVVGPSTVMAPLAPRAARVRQTMSMTLMESSLRRTEMHLIGNTLARLRRSSPRPCRLRRTKGLLAMALLAPVPTRSGGLPTVPAACPAVEMMWVREESAGIAMAAGRTRASLTRTRHSTWTWTWSRTSWRRTRTRVACLGPHPICSGPWASRCPTTTTFTAERMRGPRGRSRCLAFAL
mmetsp:Transcript_6464/g.26294  ORF Transcript_6464/g.26294 Transcript_6464/m.26294 type:complete len:308 (+) Transcript_6464:2107-3030(+)